MLPLVEELSPPPDPLETCARFEGLPFLLFFDSATRHEKLGRYSFLTADPPALIRTTGAHTQQWTQATGDWTPASGDPLAAAQRLLGLHAAAAVPGLPPFQGGVAGYLGYDWGATLERLPRPRYPGLPVPDAVLGLYDWVIAWDHAGRRAWIIATGLPERGTARVERAAGRLAFVRARLADGRTGGRPDAARSRPAGPPVRVSAPTYPVPGVPGVRSTFTRDGYLDAVARVIEYTFAGDIFQANLSQRLQSPLIGTPLALYRRLRSRNAAPFSAYLDCGDHVVASSSPERFLRVADGQVEARPIKGTRPRGAGPEDDAALAVELATSDKDRAENVMIVDLLRNDLSRVCMAGTVCAPELFTVERYATVQHLVSTVVGDLALERDATDLVRAAFPGGSVTGAPKVRAMEVIAELEPTARGVYCGAIGYWSVTGALDTSIAIRTCVVLGDEVFFQAGGGIVADSDPEKEYAETLDKARGWIAALAP